MFTKIQKRVRAFILQFVRKYAWNRSFLELILLLTILEKVTTECKIKHPQPNYESGKKYLP